MRQKLQSVIAPLSPTQFVVLGYMAAIIFTTVCLWLPITHRQGAEVTFLDAMFTATSSVTVTGLTVVDTAETFNIAGHVILLIAFHIGGIGIMALGTFLWMVLGRNISLSYRRLIMADQNRNSLSGIVRLIRILIYLSLVIEAVGALVFGLYFYLSGTKDGLLESFYFGIFHAISSYTTAGFDIFGNSLARFADDYFMQLMTILMTVFGVIGFPVLIELREYFFGKHKRFRFSLFTKITTTMFLLLVVVGAAGIWLMENNMYFAHMSWHEKLFYSLFHSVSSRSGGFSTMDMSELSNPTQFFMSLLMFVGASPSSFGGGIRTTTLALVLLTVFTYAQGKEEIRIFRRSIKQEDVIKSFVIFTAATMIVITSIVLLKTIEWHQPLSSIIFVVTSAFGACGLSAGITPELSAAGQILIMVLMFIGRIGMISLLFVFQKRLTKERYQYPKEEIIIG